MLNSDLRADENAGLPRRMDGQTPYHVPEGYFDEFTQRVLERLGELEVENFQRPLRMPYSLPEGYFQRFPESVLMEIESSESTAYLLSAAGQNSPHAVPGNYFRELAYQIMGRLVAADTSAKEELLALSPLLAQVRDRPTYSVPDSYFEKEPVKKGRVLAFQARDAHKSITWMRWAAAAIVLLLFSLGGWQFFQAEPHDINGQQTVHERLSSIPDDVIQDYLANTLNDFEVNLLAQSHEPQSAGRSEGLFDDISNQEIADYLETIAY